MTIRKLKEYTKPQLDRFRQYCNFTEQERAVFDMRAKDISIIAIEARLKEMGMPMSEATINRRIRSIKDKIENIL